ncbi:hypothetical protein ACFLT7_06060 [candidate division KSB1 bacterium]
MSGSQELGPPSLEILNERIELRAEENADAQRTLVDGIRQEQKLRQELLEKRYHSGIVQPVDPNKKVIIVGFAESTRQLTPFHRSDYEVWGLNELYQAPWHGKYGQPRWDRWFELHRPGESECSNRNLENFKHLSRLPCPVFMADRMPQVPNSVRYPIEAVQDAFPDMPNKANRYFTNTISYEIALAIMEGYSEIRVYGVDMAQASEYGVERPSCEWWMGVAYGRGIKLYLPDACDMLKTAYLYGVEDDKRYDVFSKMNDRIKEFEAHRNGVGQMRENAQADFHRLNGAIEAYQFFIRNYQLDARDPNK